MLVSAISAARYTISRSRYLEVGRCKCLLYKFISKYTYVFHWSRMEILQVCCNSVLPSGKWPNFGWVYFFHQYPSCILEPPWSILLYRSWCIPLQSPGRRTGHTRRRRTIQRSSVLETKKKCEKHDICQFTAGLEGKNIGIGAKFGCFSIFSKTS